MTEAQPNLFTRHDTFFGVCEGIGQDLGFHPNILRAVFAVALLLSPKLVLATYLGLGVVVFATRKLFPGRKSAVTTIAHQQDVATVANDQGMADLAKAA